MRVLSLFSGCGGMDLGFEGGFVFHKVAYERTAFDTVFANDIRPDAAAAWTNYFKRDVYRLGSIVDLVKAARAGESVFPDGVDVVTGGFPCQDFSVAGKRLGFDSKKSHTGGSLEDNEPTAENRGHLYMWMRDVVSITRPKLFVAENVKGLVSLADAREIISRDFAAASDGGYLVVPAKVLYAPDYGVPQSRERVIFFGFRKSALRPEALDALSEAVIPVECDPYPPKTHGDGLKPYLTCGEVLADLPEPEDAVDVSQRKFSKAKWYGDHCQGQSEIKLDSVGPTIRSEHHGNIEYRRLSRAHGGQHFDELAKGLPERRLTVRECARIQTFPDDYEFVIPGGVSASDAYKIIGNAVPPALAHAIAVNLQNKWKTWFEEQP